MGSPVVHFEISSHSAPKLHEFYSRIFDWQIDANNDMQYGLVNTGVEGNLGGGIGPTHDGQNHVTFYIQVPDLAATLAQIEAQGGKTLLPPMAVPGGPTIARFADPAGNDIGLIQG